MLCTSAVENSALQIVCLGPCVLDQCNSAMCRIVLWVAAVQIVHQGGGGCAPKGEYQTMQLSAARSFGGTHCSTSLFWYWQHYPKLFLCGGRKIFEPADKAFYQSCNFAIVLAADNSGLRTLRNTELMQILHQASEIPHQSANSLSLFHRREPILKQSNLEL